MRNYKLIIQYDGTKYSGWQKQGNTGNTIQERFERLLSKMTGEETELHGSGRTDAGVHARGQVANFKCKNDLETDFIKAYINRYLPQDIRVISVEEADIRFHSRLNAVSKHYRYSIATDEAYDVFNRNYVLLAPYDYDVDAMKEAAAFLIGRHDFKNFCDNKHMKKSTVRNITDIDFSYEGHTLHIDYKGDGFLYHMIRLITGALLMAGRNEIQPETVRDMLRDSPIRPQPAPAKGLCLMEVFY